MTEGVLIAGRYRVGRMVGRGGMGAVYAAVDERTERERAVKLMHAHVVDSPSARARFELEARVAGRVQSPFLVDVTDAGVDPETGTPYLVMELLEGEDLGRRVQRAGRLPAEQVVSHLGQVALALARIHAHGVVHRDLKPSNLFAQHRAGESPRVVVLDFGVAKVVAESRASATATAGTPLYMAPEQVRGAAVSPRTDIYAIGMISFYLLVGQPYWTRGRDLHPLAFALVIADGPRAPASERAQTCGVTLPAAFDAWFSRASARRPAERFASAIAAVRALAAALAVEAPAWLPEDDAAVSIAREAEIAGDAGDDAALATTGSSFADAAAPVATATATGSPYEVGGHHAETDTSAPLRREPALYENRTAPAIGDVGAAREQDAPGFTRAARIRRRLVAAGAVALAGVAVVLIARVRHGGDADATASSPLASATSVLACPILAVDGDAASTGWLGAAAAAAVCERARVVLGGAPTRTLTPAELLDLPRRPVDDFPDDPYAAADARDRSLAVAVRLADAYVDGRLYRPGSRYRLVLTVRDPDGTALGQATGEGRALHEAVRAALDPLVASRAIPRAHAADAAVADYSRASGVAGLLALHDVWMAMVNNAGQLADECAGFAAGASGDLDSFIAYACAYTLGMPTPPVALPDASTPGGQAARARVDHMVNRRDDPAAIAALIGRYRDEPSAWGRSAIAASLSCLVQERDPEAAAEWALRAVTDEPKNPTGEFCAPWVQLATISQGSPRAAGALRAMRAWAPWDGYGWLLEAYGAGDPDRALAFARRAYALSPFDAYVADLLADRLLARGLREEARGVALALAAGDAPAHRVESELLLVRLEASEARLGAALRRALAAMRVQPGDAGWVRVQRLEIAWRALEIALVLGRARQVADAAVAEFLDPEPPPLDGAHITASMRIPAICAYASRDASRRCFARFEALAPRLSGGVLPDTAAFTEGARRFAAGDHAGAARAWKPLVREPGPLVATLAEAMVTAFATVGERELVARLAALTADDAGRLGGATTAMVSAAVAAERRGDHAEAVRLADIVLAAWSVADEDIPALAALRRIRDRR